MPLRPIPELFADALAGGYALGYFESWSIDSLQGVIDAAEATRSPVIIGFNGEFLTHPGRRAQERIAWYAQLGRAAAESASVPCGLIFNECPQDDAVEAAILAGFNLVMLADSTAPYAQYRDRVARLVKIAHQHGAAVEAEVDELPNASSGTIITDHASNTDPELAAQFVSEVPIDLLSVSVGNIHILTSGERDLDIGLLAAIRAKVALPLGLHGGTGISAASLREAVKLGVTKVAYGTYLKQRYLAAVRHALSQEHINPHELLGIGGEHDVMVAGRAAVREAVLERIDVLGCCGRA